MEPEDEEETISGVSQSLGGVIADYCERCVLLVLTVLPR